MKGRYSLPSSFLYLYYSVILRLWRASSSSIVFRRVCARQTITLLGSPFRTVICLRLALVRISSTSALLRSSLSIRGGFRIGSLIFNSMIGFGVVSQTLAKKKGGKSPLLTTQIRSVVFSLRSLGFSASYEVPPRKDQDTLQTYRRSLLHRT